jgi:hypothetical protein
MVATGHQESSYGRFPEQFTRYTYVTTSATVKTYNYNASGTPSATDVVVAHLLE